MNKFAAIAIAALMFALAACKDKPADPTPPIVDEPDSPKVDRETCANGMRKPGEGDIRCK